MSITSEAHVAYGRQPSSSFSGYVGSEARSAAMPLVLNFEANWRLRMLMVKGLGVAMILSASGLWLFSSGPADPEMNLIKVGVSVLFFVIGLVLMTVSDPRNQPEACFDPVRQELRVLRPDSHGQPKTVLRRSYDTIGGARLREGSVQLFENDGSLLIEVPLGSAAARSQLRDQLSGSIQLYS